MKSYFLFVAFGLAIQPRSRAGIFVRLRRRESTDAAKPDGIVSGKGSSGKGAALRRLRSSASVGEPPLRRTRCGIPLRHPASASRCGTPLRYSASASRCGIPLRHPVAAFRFGIPSRHSPFGASVQTLATQRTPAEKKCVRCNVSYCQTGCSRVEYRAFFKAQLRNPSRQ